MVIAVFLTVDGNFRYAVDMEGYGALQFFNEEKLVGHPYPTVLPGCPRPGGLKSPPERSRSARLRIELEPKLLPSLAPNLAYGSLISARCFGSRWRVGVSFDAVTIDQKYRAVTPHVMVLDHDHVAIVQHQPIPVEPCRDNGVVFFPAVVPQDDNAKIISGNPCLLQGNVLCDRVVFAVSGTSVANGGLQTSSAP
jgi:hypothetical protein